MAFLDNSGDIILDAVLTDTGRKRLAKGDGSFRITKFAFGDDEINYELYNNNHASGSAYYDLNILQSPVFEAFTNNTSVMKSKLLTIARTDLLYLPVVQLNTQLNAGVTTDPTLNVATLPNLQESGSYMVTVNESTTTVFANATTNGLIRGDRASLAGQEPITFDQGIDNNALGVTPLGASNTLTETAYVVEIDNRLATLVTPEGTPEDARVSFVDDDQIASYYFSLQGNLDDSSYFDDIGQNQNGDANLRSPILGRPGLRFKFKLRATDNLAASDYLFDTLGGSTVTLADPSSQTYKFIDTTVRVTGFTTGYRVDIPIRFIKKQ